MRLECIIPARGGSKRLPKKNVIPLLGKPLISYTILAAKNCGLFSNVYVSTEDKEISAISQDSGAVVLPRKEHLASDTARVVDVTEDFLNSLKEPPVYIFVLLPTAPMRTSEDIIKAFEIIKKHSEADGLMAVCNYWIPPFWALKVEGDYISLMFPDKAKRSQELQETVVDNGSIYIVKTDSFRKYRSFYVPRLLYYKMPRLRSVDIDDEEDLKLAEAIMKYL